MEGGWVGGGANNLSSAVNAAVSGGLGRTEATVGDLANPYHE